MRNFLIVTSFVTVITLVVVSGSIDTRMKTGTLTSDISGWSQDLGEFDLHWDAQREHFSINHNGLPIWQNRPGESFLLAALGELNTKERSAHFRFKPQLTTECVDQVVTRQHTENMHTQLSGYLNCGNQQVLDWTLSIREQKGMLSLSVEVAGADFITWNFANSEDEALLGFGQQYSHLNHQGRLIDVFAQEQGVGRGRQPLSFFANLSKGAAGHAYSSYFPLPQYISTKGYGVWIDTHAYSRFDFRQTDFSQILIHQSSSKLNLWTGSEPQQLLSQWQQIMGNPRQAPAQWTQNGMIVGLQGGSVPVNQIVDELLQQRTELAGVWLQDWVGARQTSFGSQLWWQWELDQNQYPSWQTDTTAWASQGIRTLGYINPYLVEVDESRQETSLLQYAKEQNYLSYNALGEAQSVEITDFVAFPVDLSNPEAYEWLLALLVEQFRQLGIVGWMADFGEGLPLSVVLKNGLSGEQAHNTYPELWARFNQDLAQRLGDDSFYFMRAGFTSSLSTNVFTWAGDQLVSWDRRDGLASGLNALMNSGFSGIQYNHIDTGLYTGIDHPLFKAVRSRELYLRSLDLAIFQPIFRTHEGNIRDEHYQFYQDDAGMVFTARASQLFAALAEYRLAQFEKMKSTGLPYIRHPWLMWPQWPADRMDSLELFYAGDDIIVAPIVDEGRLSHQFLLPPGEWQHLFSGELYRAGADGREIILPSSIGDPIAFIRANSPFAKELVAAFRERRMSLKDNN